MEKDLLETVKEREKLKPEKRMSKVYKNKAIRKKESLAHEDHLIPSTKLEDKSTKLEDKSTKLRSNSTKLEGNSTKLEDNSTKLEDNSTKLEDNSTKLEDNGTTRVTIQENKKYISPVGNQLTTVHR